MLIEHSVFGVISLAISLIKLYDKSCNTLHRSSYSREFYLNRLSVIRGSLLTKFHNSEIIFLRLELQTSCIVSARRNYLNRPQPQL